MSDVPPTGNPSLDAALEKAQNARAARKTRVVPKPKSTPPQVEATATNRPPDEEAVEATPTGEPPPLAPEATVQAPQAPSEATKAAAGTPDTGATTEAAGAQVGGDSKSPLEEAPDEATGSTPGSDTAPPGQSSGTPSTDILVPPSRSALGHLARRQLSVDPAIMKMHDERITKLLKSIYNVVNMLNERHDEYVKAVALARSDHFPEEILQRRAIAYEWEVPPPD